MELVDIVDNVDNVDQVDAVNFRLPRHVYERQQYFQSLSEEQFYMRFRLTKATTLFLLNQIQDELQHVTNKNNCISPLNQLLITMRFFATGSHQLAIADFIQADKATVCRVSSKVAEVISSISHRFIYMPRNENEVAACQNKFYEVARFPRAIGVIDGTHIKIQSQGGDRAEIFRNRKGYFSLNVQAVGDADLLIRDLVVRWPGSAHDATIFNNSRVKLRFEQGEFGNGILLGDAAYKNTPYMLTPYGNPRSPSEVRYNRSHKLTRVKIENVFGVWKRRFPILAYGCRLKLENTINAVIATAVMHNIATSRGEVNPPIDPQLHDHEMQRLILVGDVPAAAIENNPRVDYRQLFTNTYFNN